MWSAASVCDSETEIMIPLHYFIPYAEIFHTLDWPTTLKLGKIKYYITFWCHFTKNLKHTNILYTSGNWHHSIELAGFLLSPPSLTAGRGIIPAIYFMTTVTTRQPNQGFLWENTHFSGPKTNTSALVRRIKSFCQVIIPSINSIIGKVQIKWHYTIDYWRNNFQDL
jgi:hypothetical protein